MGFLIPTEELTLTDKKRFEQLAEEAGIKRAIGKRVAATREELVTRHAQNIADFGTVLDQWNTAALAAVGTLYSVFQAIPTPTLANNQVAVFYKVQVETAPIPVSLLWFQQGAAAGVTKDVFDVEQIASYLVPCGYFTEPIVYDPQAVLNIRVVCRIATGLLARVILGCYIVEPLQQTIS